ncbi:hypothetical protein GGTG_00181 [Gaeumannomyces tritici R3-111a-1]|uniref:Uncharacterized protein n=1 Tax=Gaeumannomyces tritici (strain R3-111a-1) TaxID=644352 RepID=J3NFY8_GAET3|nr:hypothetical protein GGTG_00181 [Gaeumannomyces tritici R3-111a-1]EJT80178.1 hypothetical protein GGTG_00181 [Gaeumannomyces tritici R3-111a-1]
MGAQPCSSGRVAKQGQTRVRVIHIDPRAENVQDAGGEQVAPLAGSEETQEACPVPSAATIAAAADSDARIEASWQTSSQLRSDKRRAKRRRTAADGNMTNFKSSDRWQIPPGVAYEGGLPRDPSARMEGVSRLAMRPEGARFGLARATAGMNWVLGSQLEHGMGKDKANWLTSCQGSITTA